MSNTKEYDHRGKTIIEVDFPEGLTIESLKSVFGEAKAAYSRHPQGNILCLTVFHNPDFDQPMIDLFEAVARSNTGLVLATAFVGVTGAQKALFNAMIGVTGRKGKIFDTPDQAKDWLVSVNSDADILAGL